MEMFQGLYIKYTDDFVIVVTRKFISQKYNLITSNGDIIKMSKCFAPETNYFPFNQHSFHVCMSVKCSKYFFYTYIIYMLQNYA